ncbi:MAG: hypothetical protein MZV70_68140 [Desulfobacterales bacterium]|nr:hypothetical protein [Desulfobacterales bacterium]
MVSIRDFNRIDRLPLRDPDLLPRRTCACRRGSTPTMRSGSTAMPATAAWSSW